MPSNKIISIGWDVGGMYGKKNVFTVSIFDENGLKVYSPYNIVFTHGAAIKNNLEDLTFYKLIHLLNDDKNKILNKIDKKEYSIIISIDAPLGYPKNFKDLVNQRIESFSISDSNKAIHDNYAYRTTEKNIFDVTEKKPLSSINDSLGSLTYLAQYLMLKWRYEGFRYLPLDTTRKDNSKVIIEVYPGILKNSLNKFVNEDTLKDVIGEENLITYKDCIDYYKKEVTFLPNETKIKLSKSNIKYIDEFDSILCSLLGMGFIKSYYKIDTIPVLEMETAIENKYTVDAEQEGWIYYPKGFMGS